MEQLPFYVKPVFIVTVLATVILFYLASHRKTVVLVVIGTWVVLQGILSATEFYTVADTMPPRPFLLILPPLLLIIAMVVTKQGRHFTQRLDMGMLTLLHVVRIPVELSLFWLFTAKAVPEMMTFEGSNFDIISGITAPFIYYFGFVKRKLGKNVLLLWNFLCIGLLVNIVIIAVFSLPTPFQKLNIDEPNTGVLYFPFTWLPCVIVPLVLYAHLAAIVQLIGSRKYE